MNVRFLGPALGLTLIVSSVTTASLFSQGRSLQDGALQEGADKLPGYYEFFMKMGKQRRIRAEQQRDQRIDQEGFNVEKIDKALPKLFLPLSKQAKLDFASYKGKKNLVIVSFRAWW